MTTNLEIKPITNTSYFETVTKATSIYEGMTNTSKIQAEGLKLYDIMWQGHMGIFTALRHPAKVADALAALSDKVGDIIPAWKYTPELLHTSFPTSKHHVGEGKDAAALEAICSGIHTMHTQIPRPSIHYFGNRMTQDAVLAVGLPNEGFVEGANSVKYVCAKALANINDARKANGKQPYELNPSWGAHITVNRFLEKASKEQINEVLALVKSTPGVGRSDPVELVVGYWLCDMNPGTYAREWEVVESFPFK